MTVVGFLPHVTDIVRERFAMTRVRFSRTVTGTVRQRLVMTSEGSPLVTPGGDWRLATTGALSRSRA
jgi:hypothetical protein